jgi:hypothetical protein
MRSAAIMFMIVDMNWLFTSTIDNEEQAMLQSPASRKVQNMSTDHDSFGFFLPSSLYLLSPLRVASYTSDHVDLRFINMACSSAKEYPKRGLCTSLTGQYPKRDIFFPQNTLIIFFQNMSTDHDSFGFFLPSSLYLLSPLRVASYTSDHVDLRFTSAGLSIVDVNNQFMPTIINIIAADLMNYLLHCN